MLSMFNMLFLRVTTYHITRGYGQDQKLLKCSFKHGIFLTRESYAAVLLSFTMHQCGDKKKKPDPSQATTSVREIDRWPLRFRYGWKKDQRTTGGCPSLKMGLAQLRERDSCWSLSGRSINDNEIIAKQNAWQAAAFCRFITKHALRFFFPHYYSHAE